MILEDIIIDIKLRMRGLDKREIRLVKMIKKTCTDPLIKKIHRMRENLSEELDKMCEDLSAKLDRIP